MRPGFLQGKTVDHFVGTSAAYAHRSGIVHSEEDPIIIDFVENIDTGLGRVLEVGGGSGYLLDLLAEKTRSTQFYNCELVYQAYGKQANSRIGLVGGNALGLPFAEGAFDLVISKNLLHHLVGKTRRKSITFAQRAIDELTRVVRSGGYLIIMEQYHQYRFCAAILFYLTLILSMGSFRLVALGIRSNVVVSFLTPSQISTLLERSHAEKGDLLVHRMAAITTTWPIRLFPFLSRFGRLLLIKTVNK